MKEKEKYYPNSAPPNTGLIHIRPNDMQEEEGGKDTGLIHIRPNDMQEEEGGKESMFKWHGSGQNYSYLNFRKYEVEGMGVIPKMTLWTSLPKMKFLKPGKVFSKYEVEGMGVIPKMTLWTSLPKMS
ncbi:hypothetical protein QE152_g7404 [Popillia japonica]|uniref:Uncharacterized protein n=1 Tax=Popillia japonica TaxID=7064 RepID=A0AAW1ME49_POPJA